MSSLSPALAALRLEELQLFVSVARLGGMAASARALGLAPSVVSRRIAQLEAALGVRLFQRTTRQLKLTAAGELALESAHLALDTLASAADTMAALADRPAGTVRLAAHHLAAEVLLPPLLREFAQRHPAIRVSLIATDALVNLVDGGFDAAIHAGQLPDSQCRKRTMATPSRKCAASIPLISTGFFSALAVWQKSSSGRSAILRSANSWRKKYGVVSASKPTVLFLYVFKALGSLASGSTPKSAGSKSKFRLSPNRVMRPSLSNSA